MCDRGPGLEAEYNPSFVPTGEDGNPLSEDEILAMVTARAASYFASKMVEVDYE